MNASLSQRAGTDLPRRRSAIVFTASVIFALSACSGDGDEDDEAAGNGDVETEDTFELTIGVMPIADTAPVFLADELGYFDEEGITLDIQTASSGAAIVPGVASDSYDIGFGNYASVMIAGDQGISMTYISPGVAEPFAETGRGATGVVALGDSGIDSAADLEGRSVSVVALVDSSRPTISDAVRQDGGDPDRVEFVEMSFPEVQAAIENGHLDAGYLVEPFLSTALANGFQVVTYNLAELDPSFPIAGYYVQSSYLDENPEAVEAFQRALSRGLEYAGDNPDEVRRIVTTYTSLEEDQLDEITFPLFPSEFSQEGVQIMADLLVEYELVSQEPDVAALLGGQ